jgi:LmbE family N-acetylglucosaminyl deacetylase
MVKLKVLAIASHADDIALGCAGTIAKHVKAHDEVFLLILTRGEEGGDPKMRTEETVKSAAVLGIPQKNVHFGNLPDTKMFENLRKAILEIESATDKYNPFRVYTSSSKDRHQDHVATAMAAKAACRKVHQILAYETPSTLVEFSPQAFVDISETLSLKIKSIRMHQSQSRKVYMKAEAARGLARFRGLQAGVKAAEAFEVYRMIL